MKNILLGTSALVGAALVAGAALAEDPKVMVGGVIDFQAGYVSEDNDANTNDIGFRNETLINVSVDGKTDSGLGYGAVVDLQADINGGARSQGANAARTYTFLDGSFGRVELGSVEGATQTMQVDAATIARATGGISGDYDMFVTQPTAGTTTFISRGQLPTNMGNIARIGGSDSVDNVAKVNYYSPRFSGFQFGGSYTPNSSSRGATVRRDDASNAFSNIFEAALGYEGQFSNVGVKAALAGEVGDSNTVGGEDLQAWNAGTVLSYAGFSAAASYGDLDDTYGAGSDADYYTLGAAYDFGPFGVSATWLDSQVSNNDFNNLVLGADYALAPGLTPYAEVSFFEADAAGANTAANSNEGTVALVGTQLAF